MTPETWIALGGLVIVTVFSIWAMEAAYRNGVNDGYMFSKDPTCPGYQKARRILQRYGKIN